MYLNCYQNIRMVIPHKLHCGFLNLTGQTHLVTLTQPIVYSYCKTKNINNILSKIDSGMHDTELREFVGMQHPSIHHYETLKQVV